MCSWIFHCVKSVQIRSYLWSVFSCIRTEYGEILRISPYSARKRENTDQKKLRIWKLFTQCSYFISFVTWCILSRIISCIHTFTYISLYTYICMYIHLCYIYTHVDICIYIPGAFPEILERARKILGFRWSKKTEITLKTIIFGQNIFISIFKFSR